MALDAPSAGELEAHPIVRQAVEQAWEDSLPDDPRQRHEEGGWIYMNPITGDLTVLRAAPGRRAVIDLNDPPVVPGSVVVGKFHTHPNPTAEGWNPGPSQGDMMVDATHGVPDLIRADDGVHYSGPAHRRGGLGGNPGYPA